MRSIKLDPYQICFEIIFVIIKFQMLFPKLGVCKLSFEL